MPYPNLSKSAYLPTAVRSKRITEIGKNGAACAFLTNVLGGIHQLPSCEATRTEGATKTRTTKKVAASAAKLIFNRTCSPPQWSSANPIPRTTANDAARARQLRSVSGHEGDSEDQRKIAWLVVGRYNGRRLGS